MQRRRRAVFAALTEKAPMFNTKKHRADTNAPFDATAVSNIDELIRCADTAFKEEDGKKGHACCEEAARREPDNPDVCVLLAKYVGWNPKPYQLDVDAALNAITHALDQLPDSMRYQSAADIYQARKQQIASLLEAELSMPSHTSAVNLQKTMTDWCRLLAETPYLNPDLIDGEVNLVDNLCTRSKMGIMPNDRLVYSAYQALNDKKSYGETFRETLEPVIEQEKLRQKQVQAVILDDAEKRAQTLTQWLAQLRTADERAARLDAEVAALNEDIETIRSMTNWQFYRNQLDDLEASMGETRSFKLIRQRAMQSQQRELQNKIAAIEKDLDPAIAPLNNQLDRVKAALSPAE